MRNFFSSRQVRFCPFLQRKNCDKNKGVGGIFLFGKASFTTPVGNKIVNPRVWVLTTVGKQAYNLVYILYNLKRLRAYRARAGNLFRYGGIYA